MLKAIQYSNETTSETAKEALNRYTKFLKLNFKNDIQEAAGYLPCFFSKVKKSRLDDIEQQFDFKFPPSYTNFVLKNGLFKFGRWSDNDSELLKLSDINTLHNELAKQWTEGFNNLSEEDQEATKNLICFSYGDESLQAVWYYCFDKRSLNPETGEMAVYSFSQDDWHFDALKTCTNKGFDKHITNLVNEKMEEI